MISPSDCIKRELLRINRLLDTLQNLHLVTITKEDLIKWRGARYRRKIRFGQEGHDIVTESVSRNAPLLVARIGAVELSCLRFYLEKRVAKKAGYSRKIRSTMTNNAGFFPADDASLDAFAELFLDNLAQVDIMGVWFNQYEDVDLQYQVPGCRAGRPRLSRAVPVHQSMERSPRRAEGVGCPPFCRVDTKTVCGKTATSLPFS